MNRENIQASINILQRVIDRGSNFDINFWASPLRQGVDASEESYHACGMSACWGGWVGVSPEWPGGVDYSGGPTLINGYGEKLVGTCALAHWLDVDLKMVASIAGLVEVGEYYAVRKADITPQMVITKLEDLLNG